MRPLQSRSVHRRTALFLAGHAAAGRAVCTVLRWLSAKRDRRSRACLQDGRQTAGLGGGWNGLLGQCAGHIAVYKQ